MGKLNSCVAHQKSQLGCLGKLLTLSHFSIPMEFVRLNKTLAFKGTYVSSSQYSFYLHFNWDKLPSCYARQWMSGVA